MLIYVFLFADTIHLLPLVKGKNLNIIEEILFHSIKKQLVV